MARRGGDKIHNRNKELGKEKFRRQTNNKQTVADVIIACEDSVSAPAYFKKIVDKLIEDRKITQDSFVIAPHAHTNPSGVLKDLKEYKGNNNKTYKDFEHKWIVIDRDAERVNGGGHTLEDFNNALQNAKSKQRASNIEVAYSNDSFEFWYLLHFSYRDTAILRDEIIEKLIEEFKKLEPQKFARLSKDDIKTGKYTKMIFDILLDKQEQAIKNATTLLAHKSAQDNPSTRVHILVDILNKLGE